MSNPIHVFVDTSPLQNANAIRGVGVYTKFLTEALKRETDVQVVSDLIDTLNEKIDITHYPYFDLFFATLPFTKKTKTIVTIHDVIPLLFPKQYKPGIKGRIRLARQLLALKSVDAVITDSETSKKDIHYYLKVPTAKIHVVYLAANPELQPADLEEVQRIRKKYRLPQQYVLYIGDINYNKNIPQLIKSLKYLPEDIQLVCVGRNFVPQEIPEWKVIETQLALSDVANRVCFLNEVSGKASKDMSALYGGAVAYIQPSLYEGFGLPVLEAMSSKTPVVSAENSSLIEVGGKSVVFVRTDAESIAKGVKEILQWSEQKRKTVVEEAYAWAHQFSWEKTARETIAVYKSLL
jgi:glycosyltransferase involved in cell wall biosynthesis